jgi:biotin carboxyl carrier protein
MPEIVRVKVEDKWYTVEVGDLTRRPVTAVVDGHTIQVGVEYPAPQPDSRSQGRVARPSTPTTRPASSAPSPASRPADAIVGSASVAAKLFTAPLPGTILSIEVNPGDQVVTGDPICVLEAMKMHQELRADWSGVVKEVMVAVGQQVLAGTPIVELE